jgi:UDP-N-acetylmuramoyl-L-alanyl-D-glutamate--2,6-diaminopimelate ligase
MQLAEILKGIAYKTAGCSLTPTAEITKIAIDSRQVAAADTLFVAMRGTQTDGHDFIEKVATQGGQYVVCQALPTAINADICYILVADTQKILGELAANFYGQPSEKMQVVGITGTNGKTTTTTLLYHLFTDLGYTVGLISTVSYRIGLREYPSTHTTPDALRLQALFAEMLAEGCQYVFMEVSSHAAHQHRIGGTKFTGAAFTNLSHDHLDYHGTFRAYMDAKKMFFDALPTAAFALVNLDARQARYMLQNCKAVHLTYALEQPADYKAKIKERHLSGMILELDSQDVHTRLVGDFNAYNLLAVYGIATQLLQKEKNIEKYIATAQLLSAISRLQAAEGRFDTVALPAKPKVLAVVDYAHTPDALEKILQALNGLRAETARIITVVGCGGDRDKTKRPIMAKIAAQNSQILILTADNPRSEQPEEILKDMEKGLDSNSQAQIISDRAAAIAQAYALAHAGDIILVAGKGHEKYQEIQGVRYDFDDKQVLAQLGRLTNE